MHDKATCITKPVAAGDGTEAFAVSHGSPTHLPFVFIAVEGDRNLLDVVEMLCSLGGDHLHFELIRKERDRQASGQT